jgi:hypothetical protein
MHFSPSVLGWRFMALDKNLLGVFKCEHIKTLDGFT